MRTLIIGVGCSLNKNETGAARGVARRPWQNVADSYFNTEINDKRAYTYIIS